MKRKRYAKTFFLKEGGRCHGVRSRQENHGVVTAEGWCGRGGRVLNKYGLPVTTTPKGDVDCSGCLSSMAAQAS